MNTAGTPEHVLPIFNSLSLLPPRLLVQETIKDSTWLKIFEEEREKRNIRTKLNFVVS